MVNNVWGEIDREIITGIMLRQQDILSQTNSSVAIGNSASAVGATTTATGSFWPSSLNFTYTSPTYGDATVIEKPKKKIEKKTLTKLEIIERVLIDCSANEKWIQV